jgi:hypothetical protein
MDRVDDGSPPIQRAMIRVFTLDESKHKRRGAYRRLPDSSEPLHVSWQSHSRQWRISAKVVSA